VRCACHLLNFIVRDDMAMISETIENIKKLVLAMKGSRLQWEELMKHPAQCGWRWKKKKRIQMI
jgi:hypothetical protein